jgi:hypothetical protein
MNGLLTPNQKRKLFSELALKENELTITNSTIASETAVLSKGEAYSLAAK